MDEGCPYLSIWDNSVDGVNELELSDGLDYILSVPETGVIMGLSCDFYLKRKVYVYCRQCWKKEENAKKLPTKRK